jgi:hypothetical protein
MHEIPNISSKSSKILHRSTIQSYGKPAEQPIGLIPTRDGKFPQKIIQAMFNEVIWFLGMSSHSKTKGRCCLWVPL